MLMDNGLRVLTTVCFQLAILTKYITYTTITNTTTTTTTVLIN